VAAVVVMVAGPAAKSKRGIKRRERAARSTVTSFFSPSFGSPSISIAPLSLPSARSARPLTQCHSAEEGLPSRSCAREAAKEPAEPARATRRHRMPQPPSMRHRHLCRPRRRPRPRTSSTPPALSPPKSPPRGCSTPSWGRPSPSCSDSSRSIIIKKTRTRRRRRRPALPRRRALSRRRRRSRSPCFRASSSRKQ
jgi:hypothetical protein